MSARYSSSPALRLTIGRSRLRSALYGGLCLAVLAAVTEIYGRGYPALCLPVLLLVTPLLWRLRRDSLVGTELCWQQGLWTLERGQQRRSIALSRRCTATPWVIYLAFNEVPAGPGGHCWLYADCASRQQLRRLRVRLSLLH